MRLSPGDRVEVEAIEIAGERVWVMRPVRDPDLSFFGCLRARARDKTPGMDKVRDEIVKAMKERPLD